MQDWASGIYVLLGAIVGVLGTMIAQWLNAKHVERIEHTKWEQEEAKEVREAIREFRKERAKPILDALDRASLACSMAWRDIEVLMQK
jgi:H+/gluconate symporter-like permease